jgi:hypothetical protein
MASSVHLCVLAACGLIATILHIDPSAAQSANGQSYGPFKQTALTHMSLFRSHEIHFTDANHNRYVRASAFRRALRWRRRCTCACRTAARPSPCASRWTYTLMMLHLYWEVVDIAPTHLYFRVFKRSMQYCIIPQRPLHILILKTSIISWHIDKGLRSWRSLWRIELRALAGFIIGNAHVLHINLRFNN